MSETPSTMLPLGTVAPEFNLPDTISGKNKSLSELKSDKATVIMFICNHCPYVRHIQKKLVEVVKTYQQKGISFVAISSNDAKRYESDGPEYMKEEASMQGYTFPYLYDESQEVARAYQAACTPDLYLFDKDLKCVYRGRFDESTPGNHKPSTGKELINALDAVLAGKKVDDDQKPSVGCNIKWK
jgi:peroxiredoxin